MIYLLSNVKPLMGLLQSLQKFNYISTYFCDTIILVYFKKIEENYV